MEIIFEIVRESLVEIIVFILCVLFYSWIVREPLRIIHRGLFDYMYTQSELDALIKVIKAHEIIENPSSVDEVTYYRAISFLTKLYEKNVDVEYKSKTFLLGNLIIYYDVRAKYI